MNKHYFKTWCK